jgi:nucleoside-diphosphate-sugar epimerase
MRVGVTAAGGFLGRYVCQALVQEGHTVVGIDSRFVENIEVHSGRALDHDLTSVFRECEVILHLEWSGSFRKASDHPLATLTQNLATLHHCLSAAQELRSRFVFASTGIVYGGNLTVPTLETDDVRPRSHYGLQKLHAEGAVRIASELGGFDAISARVFNLFGEGATDSAQIIPRLRSAYESGQPFRLTGDGMQQRDFLAVEDAAGAFVRFANLKGYQGETFNLGSGIGTSMLGLAETFYAIKGVATRIDWVPAVPGESRVLIADMNKTQDAIGFTPKVNVETGLRRLLGAGS